MTCPYCKPSRRALLQAGKLKLLLLILLKARQLQAAQRAKGQPGRRLQRASLRSREASGIVRLDPITSKRRKRRAPALASRPSTLDLP
jgi:hypothetical protein